MKWKERFLCIVGISLRVVFQNLPQVYVMELFYIDPKMPKTALFRRKISFCDTAGDGHYPFRVRLHFL